ncbi:MAG: AMP-dependent synthetase/ligase, partial [Pyrinomonadaceae bacterium]
METTEQLTASTALGEPASVGEPETIIEVMLRALTLKARPDALNYKREGEWRPLSSEELLRRVRRVALGLHALGLRRGDRAGILSESSPEWVIVDLGCQFAGIVNVPLYPTLAPQQVCYITEDSGARLLFVQDAAAYERVREVLASCATLSTVVLLSGAAGAGVLTLAELEESGARLEAEQPRLIEELSGAVTAEDLATIIYTSGTTGEPKGVMLTHANVVSNLTGTSERLAFTPEDVVLSVLPLSHVFERGAMYMYLHHGAKVFFAEAIDRVGANMREVHPTLLIAVPRLFEKIYERIKDKAAEGGRVKTTLLMWAVRIGKRWAHATVWKKPVSPLLKLQQTVASRLVFSKWREATGGRIRLFCSGGAALPEELGLVFYGAGLPIVQGYGLTETSPVICVNGPGDNRIGTVGRPIRHVEVRLAADGEIETRGPNVMRGYYNKPEATREV